MDASGNFCLLQSPTLVQRERNTDTVWVQRRWEHLHLQGPQRAGCFGHLLLYHWGSVDDTWLVYELSTGARKLLGRLGLSMCIMSPKGPLKISQRKAVLVAISYEGQQGEDGQKFSLPALLHELRRKRKFLILYPVDWTYDKNKHFKPRLRYKNYIFDDWIMAVRKTLLRFLTVEHVCTVRGNTACSLVSRTAPLKIDSRYYIKLEQLRVLVAGATAWESVFSSGYVLNGPRDSTRSASISTFLMTSSRGWLSSLSVSSVPSAIGHVAPSTGVRPMGRPSEGPHLWRAIDYVHWDATPLDVQIPHTAIVLFSEFDDCDERPHHLPTNIRTGFAAVLSYITVCRHTMTGVSVWKCTMERASKKRCVGVLRKRDVDNTATTFAGGYSKAGTKDELPSMDVYRRQGLPVRHTMNTHWRWIVYDDMVLQLLFTGAAPMSGTLISASSDKQQSLRFGGARRSIIGRNE
ncbi:hypothetical protein BU17DRAFT_65248 [Hysterangium stoloniferum]|nr:hypothetical protein BU17DRAFT_65248 [Hysterangium stoloniferum]